MPPHLGQKTTARAIHFVAFQAPPPQIAQFRPDRLHPPYRRPEIEDFPDMVAGPQPAEDPC